MVLCDNPVRLQFDLHADEQQEQAVEPDPEVAKQSEEHVSEQGGQQPADHSYDMDNDRPVIK